MAAETGAQFEEYVGQLLRLAGYTVLSDVLVDGTQIDHEATRSEGFARIRYLVECTDKASDVGIGYVKEKAASLLATDRGEALTCLLLVARGGFTAQARAFANERPTLILKSVHDLESELINFEPYRDWYLHNFSASLGAFGEARLHERYVETTVRDPQGSTRPVSAEARDWLADERDNVLFLLGDYGAGKTSFLRHFTYDLLSEGSELLPLLIPLRGYRTALSLRQVITDTLVNDYHVSLPSFATFERYCALGRVLLLLDGFDEMAARSDKQTIADCLGQVFLLAETNAKILVTCRSNFFRSHQDVVDALRSLAIEVSEAPNRVDEASPLGRHGRLVTIQPLAPLQIREFVERQFPDEVDELLEQIGRIHDLSDLCRRPVLLDMILRTLPELRGSRRRISSAELYTHYTDRWTLRDEWRVRMPLTVRQPLCEGLAWSLLANGEHDLSYEDLRAGLDLVLEDNVRDREYLEDFLNDIQTCSFLVRSGEAGNYSFSHKSFMEFFVARRIGRALLGETALGETTPPPRVFLDNVAWGPQTIYSHFTMHRSFYGLFDNRLRAGGLRATPASDESRQEAHAALATALETRATQVFTTAGDPLAIKITPEIATFALEWLESNDAGLAAVLDGAERHDLVGPACDIIRHARGRAYFTANLRVAVARMRRSDDPRVQAALAAALVQTEYFEDGSRLAELANAVDAGAFSYACFEIAHNGSAPAIAALQSLETRGELSGLPSLIAAFSRREALESDDYAARMAGKLDDIEAAGLDADEVYSLLASTLFEEGGLLNFAAFAFERTTPKPVQEALLRMLRGYPASSVRFVRVRARDQSVRAELQRLESEMDDTSGVHRGRRGSVARFAGVRNEQRQRLWNALAR